MTLRCGIVGLPNVGKSTLFNALTNLNIEVKNYPFCTITPNFGQIPIFDNRLNNLSKIVSSKKIVHSYIEFVDVAGLIEGASRGEGLGNQFLMDIRNTDAIIHVVRCFNNNMITHVRDKVSPIEDIEIINCELIFSDFELCDRSISKMKKVKVDKKIEKLKLSILLRCLDHLKKVKMLNTLNLSEEDKSTINDFKFLTLKPVMYVANTSIKKQDTLLVEKILNFSKKHKILVHPVFLDNINQDFISNNQKHELLKTNTLSDQLQKIVLSSLNLLNLHTFFTVGKQEVRAWNVMKNSTLKEAAKKIHSDFFHGFIRSKVISYKDFIMCKGEQQARLLGKVRIEGKKYIVRDGDILHFLFNVNK